MIYTITFNPALDYVVRVEDFKIGGLNRTSYEDVYAGGKGINVSMVLKNLGVDSVVLGYIAGFTGDEIERRVTKWGCITDFIKLNDGMSRINVKLKSNMESEINGRGPDIDEDAINMLYKKLDILTEDDFLVLAGSIPNTLPENIYENIMKRLKDKNIKFVVDATGYLLLNVLKYKPFLIKPNHHELGELFGVKIKSHEEIIKYAKKLQEMGAQNVLVSMAENGAIFVSSEGEEMKSDVPKGILKNSVGAGDSMVAGFIAGFLKNNNLSYAFKLGLATGSASAFSQGLATKSEVDELLKQII
ncbi:1-phosphofructokinase (plasmid) [Clostridium botulinum]|uniref:Tagatose-6-phosphate kinase n=1 Tax=Clostridium botulinum C/D str. DC5 TaxID=1443128 RepID=A0A0A0HUU0_CLOBO|nr:1-phosphofructokinase [Clostridium botulinum]KEI00033.1 1-phosphofructokinase [Clostridium botulinum C/D str. BKT75002]KEI05817.1 1-phosphofructokinase [Clostridium botulinum C/D str. BKT2873]KGM92964.1 1-phosphofructokinase [Clostridium botulinum C/D str. DC5]KOC45929.1 1-phosphofructokinase [Clostridium botulinum]KOC50805.1 1-phosphofructokinase [Clostridium botulinum]